MTERPKIQKEKAKIKKPNQTPGERLLKWSFNLSDKYQQHAVLS